MPTAQVAHLMKSAGNVRWKVPARTASGDATQSLVSSDEPPISVKSPNAWSVGHAITGMSTIGWKAWNQSTGSLKPRRKGTDMGFYD